VIFYLGLFCGDEEVCGWVLGRYDDFAFFHNVVREHFALEELPLLLGCSDCDAAFAGPELAALRTELSLVAARFKRARPITPAKAFAHNNGQWSQAASLYDCFRNVDDENLVDAMLELCDRGASEKLTLLFQ